MDQVQPKVSIVTVNFNQPAVTADLLYSLQKLTYTRWEVLIVDNGSIEKMDRGVMAQFPNLIYVELKENLGFAGGNNAALTRATGEYLCFVNNDTEVPEDFLEPLIEVFENQDNVGLVSPKILYFSNGRIQYSGTTELNPLTIRNKGIGWMQEDLGQYDYVRETGYIHGAAMMTTKAVLNDVGPMYEDYFLYYEELDWAARVRQKGYKIFYCGKSHIFHKESVTTGVDSPLKVYYLMRNRLIFARRNFPRYKAAVAFSYYMLVAVPKNVLQWLLRRRVDLVGAVLKGVWWNLTHRVK